MLATLLFSDIVDSTGHAKRVADARWQSLLEEFRLAVRREQSRPPGTGKVEEIEVLTTRPFLATRGKVYQAEVLRCVERLNE